MYKQCVRWKPFKTKSARGSDYESCFPDLIDLCCRGSLISQILTMEKKGVIGFEEAARMAREKYASAINERRIGYLPGESFWYLEHFVEWISSLGYHIELTGDEATK